MTIRPNLAVYGVPIRFLVEGKIFVIAESAAAAAKAITEGMLEDFLLGDDESVGPSEIERGTLTDWNTPETFGTGGLEVTLAADYEVEDHPDYNPSEHDEEETPTEEPK